ncbi:MAG: DUF523 domain-containing protein [Clostridia bacterium]|nr:DUF523 domain-containing protein [Clostridia bacterium]
MKAEWEQPSSHLSEEPPQVLVSACLAGCPCRFDGATRPDPELEALAAAGIAAAACPECLGGLPIPRPPAEIVGGSGEDVLDGRARVMTRDGRDVTEAFLEGARAFRDKVLAGGIREVVLKSKSPSCGLTAIYDGTFSGTLRPGPGVTAALLRRSGILVREK